VRPSDLLSDRHVSWVYGLSALLQPRRKPTSRIKKLKEALQESVHLHAILGLFTIIVATLVDSPQPFVQFFWSEYVRAGFLSWATFSILVR
jgi:hypothetical protein